MHIAGGMGTLPVRAGKYRPYSLLILILQLGIEEILGCSFQSRGLPLPPSLIQMITARSNPADKFLLRI